MNKEDRIIEKLAEVQEKSEKICDNKSVGMIIKRNGKILLLERMKPPYGFTFPAGHVDDHGSFEQAAIDETMEETGLHITKLTPIFEGKLENQCRRTGGTWHDWKIYNVETEGEINFSREESKKAGWYSMEEIKELVNKTKEYLDGEITDEQWIKDPGMEPLFYLQLGIDKLVDLSV